MQNPISYIHKINQSMILNEICRNILEYTFPINVNWDNPKIECLDIKIKNSKYIMGALNLDSHIDEHFALNKLIWDKTFLACEIHYLFQLDANLNEYLILYFYYRCLFIMGDSVTNETIHSFFVKITEMDLKFLENIIFFKENYDILPIDTKTFIENIRFNISDEAIEQLRELYAYLKRELKANTPLYFYVY